SLTWRVRFPVASLNRVLVSIQDKAPARLGQLTGEFADEFERIVLNTLAKDKAERYQTASELFEDLRKLEQELEFKSKSERFPQSQSASDVGHLLSSSTRAIDSSSYNNLRTQLTSLIDRIVE